MRVVGRRGICGFDQEIGRIKSMQRSDELWLDGDSGDGHLSFKIHRDL